MAAAAHRWAPPAGLRLALTATLTFAMAIIALPAQAQYKWKDERGQVHLSDLPPPSNVPERNILQRPRVTASAAAAAKASASADGSASGVRGAAPASAPQDPELARRQAAAEASARAKADADTVAQKAERAQNCQRARQQLAMMQSGQRLVRVNAAGERVVLDEAARQSEMQLARRVADSDCR